MTDEETVTDEVFEDDDSSEEVSEEKGEQAEEESDEKSEESEESAPPADKEPTMVPIAAVLDLRGKLRDAKESEMIDIKIKYLDLEADLIQRYTHSDKKFQETQEKELLQNSFENFKTHLDKRIALKREEEEERKNLHIIKPGNIKGCGDGGV